MEHGSILVVITSALFADQRGMNNAVPDAKRLNRLSKTIAHVKAAGLFHIAVADNTIPAGESLLTWNIAGAELINPEPSHRFAHDEYAVNGPSRMEAILLYDALPVLQEIAGNYELVLKISAGYQVRNIEAILKNARQGIVFRMGNPFRRKIRFCLTSFYLLPPAHFITLISHFAKNIDRMNKNCPLEYFLYEYVSKIKAPLLPISYPRFDAEFMSSGRTSNDKSYQMREQVFTLLSKAGLYAYKIR